VSFKSSWHLGAQAPRNFKRASAPNYSPRVYSIPCVQLQDGVCTRAREKTKTIFK
jgi:hypothetical protein